MADAIDIRGGVFKNGSATLVARIVGADGSVIQQADVSAIAYTIYRVDPNDADGDTAIDGHEGVAVTVADVIFDTLQTGDLWDVDDTGYNFKHVIDVGTNAAFAVAGATYRVVYTLTSADADDLRNLVRFRVVAI